MGANKWTPQQQNAINAVSGSLLLSAAAGSGKTAVLVERIIRILTDENNTTQPENLLVVTFTNAAAAEMKQRIAEAIDTLANKNPNEPKYGEIRMKLSDAVISTMDSFCIKTVRENYHMLNIEPDFKVLDDSELLVMQSTAIEALMDRLCTDSPEIYDRLINLSGNSYNDTTLKSKIQKLYDISLSYPYPEKWLDGICELFKNEDGTKIWKNTINEYCFDASLMCLDMLTSLRNTLCEREDILSVYEFNIGEIEGVLKNFVSKIDSDNWNDTVSAFNGYSFSRLKTAPKAIKDDYLTDYTKTVINSVKDKIKKLPEYYCATDEENEQDKVILSQYITALCNCVKEYSQILDKLKKEANGYGFSDFMHMCLNLFDDGNGNKTSLAEKTAEQFDEILIDEYQDTNDAQNMLFESISRDGNNLFTVGDVKQSIYSFRMAKPELFIKKAESYSDYDGKAQKSKIILGMNFRSRKGVLEGINYLFGMLMSKKSAGIDYNENEKLNFGNLSYGEDENIPLEMHIIDGRADAVRDAKYIGNIINEIMNDGITVNDKKEGKRKCRYSDFCILLRGLKNKSDVYAKTLNEMGIPTYAQKKEGLFDTTEINLVISLLSAIDNPSDDVSVLSAMYSPVFGFTPDEIAQIRLLNRDLNLYSLIKLSSNMGNEHSREFIEKIEEYRNLSAVLPIGEYINTVLEESSYPYVVNAMAHGDARKANLYMFGELASTYEANGGSSMGGFIRFIKKNIENKVSIPVALDISENTDVVRVFSIHKSKGLEFPFVIVSDCGGRMNMTDINDNFIVDSKTGAGMKIIDNENLKKYSTLSLCAAKINARKNMMAEEMRIFYVALTRARERLITVSSVENAPKKINEALLVSNENGKIHSFASLNVLSYFEWLAMTYLKHPDSRELRRLCESPKITEIDGDFRMKFVLCGDMTDETVKDTTVEYESDNDVINAIKAKTEYVYPFEKASRIVSKHTASEYEKQRFSPDFFAKTKPSFMYNGKLSPAQTGTANHLFLQLCDFENYDIEAQIEKLVNDNKLTKEQGEVIDRKKINTFLQSDLCKRMVNSECLMREKQFAVFVNANMFDNDLPDYAGNEKVFVQGMTDAVFTENGKAYIVDYKTDRIENEEQLKLLYTKQLSIYKTAMESVLHMSVEKTYIYSLHLGKTIEI